jgi:hypothetical protein
MKRLLGILVAAAMAWPASAQVLLHADTPLFGGSDQTWPEHFSSGDSFGCKSAIFFGVWKRTDAPDREAPDEPPDTSWLRVDNYGVFHCAYILSEANQEPFEWEDYEYSLLVKLGSAKGPKGPLDLYAFQKGFRPGSTYLLLAAEPTDADKAITRFFVLAPDCPRDWWRGNGVIDVWRTDYCAVPDKAGLRRIAVSAARRPPAATLEYVGPDPEDAE